QKPEYGKAFLGVGTEDREDGGGVRIKEVMEETAASKAGLQVGDLII
ncbi:MAG: PDZ domain-containing protein, partial [Akkermansiaceae bacterium]|nr:PDZ domain-containing protein [Akkermansiaceae bacterium]